MPDTYRIVRMYKNDKPSKVVMRGLTLEQAQAHCREPETSSSTAKSVWAQGHTAVYGPWFEGYEKESP